MGWRSRLFRWNLVLGRRVCRGQGRLVPNRLGRFNRSLGTLVVSHSFDAGPGATGPHLYRRDHPGCNTGCGSTGGADTGGEDLREKRRSGSLRSTGRSELAHRGLCGTGSARQARLGGAHQVVKPLAERTSCRQRRCERGSRRWCGAIGPHLGLAVLALPKVSQQVGGETRVRFAIDEGRERGRELLASASLLDASEDRPESLSALCQAPIYFGIGPSRYRTNLGVRVALGEQGEGAKLLRLQRLQRFPGSADPFAALGGVGWPVLLGGKQLNPIRVVVAP